MNFKDLKKRWEVEDYSTSSTYSTIIRKYEDAKFELYGIDDLGQYAFFIIRTKRLLVGYRFSRNIWSEAYYAQRKLPKEVLDKIKTMDSKRPRIHLDNEDIIGEIALQEL